MTYQMKKQWLLAIPVCASLLFLSACQEKPAPSADANTPAAEQKNNASSTLIQGKVERIPLQKNQFCDDQGCTQYDLQTIKTNVPWIDEYFLQRIKKAVPTAFTNENKEAKADAEKVQGINQSTIYVRFISQNNNLATFMIYSYEYSAGAAHGMYHQEFVTFDLNKQKRLALSDILKPNTEATVAQALYEANANWLEQHNITPQKLQLSDNFYYGVNGLVFVYPLYEIAAYAEGMPELKLPYVSAKDVVKAEYLPSLPQYANP
ncbi:RsiV family protein [Acinetobacter gerneri]|uniref:RsiV family protein n=1 Tax=Acinetobacter gerneri TaxID=202952 RepID=UPI002935B15A|nr:RsiV family protein [Acinetobacter gerneri]MDV2438164.1 RsiV family protein [Acinetobacter gerneri]